MVKSNSKTKNIGRSTVRKVSSTIRGSRTHNGYAINNSATRHRRSINTVRGSSKGKKNFSSIGTQKRKKSMTNRLNNKKKSTMTSKNNNNHRRQRTQQKKKNKKPTNISSLISATTSNLTRPNDEFRRESNFQID